MLLGVQSVGPKVALAVLGGGTPRDLVRALAAGDVARLQAVPGIGKRTAERIIVELREKVGHPGLGRRADHRHARRRPAASSPATACSSSGSRPPRPRSCSTGAEGSTAEELLASALKAAHG